MVLVATISHRRYQCGSLLKDSTRLTGQLMLLDKTHNSQHFQALRKLLEHLTKPCRETVEAEIADAGAPSESYQPTTIFGRNDTRIHNGIAMESGVILESIMALSVSNRAKSTSILETSSVCSRKLAVPQHTIDCGF